MKIVLSRKGFDSSSGGYPSIIYDDKIISFPIPETGTEDNYKCLQTDLGITYGELFSELNVKAKTGFNTAHVDPDIYRNIRGHIKREKGWNGIFGQDDSAQSHLANCGITEDAPHCLLLFFGWFQFAEKKNGKMNYQKSDDYPNGFHALYGFMEVGRIIDVKDVHNIPAYAKDHTHVKNKSNRKGHNKLYLPIECSRIGLKKTCGVFKFKDDLILTKVGESRRSYWKLDKCFKGIKMTYHREVDDPENFKSVGRGQEFVIQDNYVSQMNTWAVNLINNHL